MLWDFLQDLKFVQPMQCINYGRPIIKINEYKSMQSRRHRGLTPQTRLQAPPKWNWNTINQLRFCQFLECQAPPHKPKALPQKRKAPLMKNFWRRFWKYVTVFMD